MMLLAAFIHHETNKHHEQVILTYARNLPTECMRGSEDQQAVQMLKMDGSHLISQIFWAECNYVSKATSLANWPARVIRAIDCYITLFLLVASTQSCQKTNTPYFHVSLRRHYHRQIIAP
jgi:hypothetical protein